MSKGIRVPGLPEGLEIVRIAERPLEEYATPSGPEYVFTGTMLHQNNLYPGDIIVRALPGWEIRFEQGAGNVVVKCEQKREPGWYWVKGARISRLISAWEPAKWDGEAWEGNDSENQRWDDDYFCLEVGPRIEPPKE